MSEEKKNKKEPKEKKKANPVILLLIVMLLLIVLLGAGFVYLIMNTNKGTVATPVATQQTTVVDVPENSFALEDFIVNLQDTDKSKFIKLNVSLAYSKAKLSDELKLKTGMVRDAINTSLREKKAADFTAKGVEDLKKEIMDKINPGLTSGKVSEVYVNSIVVQ